MHLIGVHCSAKSTKKGKTKVIIKNYQLCEVGHTLFLKYGLS